MVEPTNPSDSPATKLLKWEQAITSAELHRGTARQKPRVFIRPKNYDREQQSLVIKNYIVSYKTSSRASAVLGIVMTSRNIKKSWAFKRFLGLYKDELEADGILTTSQLRTAVKAINDMAARQTEHNYFDIFIIDKGFALNPKYHPRKQI